MPNGKNHEKERKTIMKGYVKKTKKNGKRTSKKRTY